MQIVSNGDNLHEMSNPVLGDNLHEMSNPVFWENLETYHQFVVCWISLDIGKG